MAKSCGFESWLSLDATSHRLMPGGLSDGDCLLVNVDFFPPALKLVLPP